MAELLQLSSLVMRTATRFDPNVTRRQLGKVRQYMVPPELLAKDYLAVGIYAMHLEHILCDVEANPCYLHCRLLRTVPANLRDTRAIMRLASFRSPILSRKEECYDAPTPSPARRALA